MNQLEMLHRYNEEYKIPFNEELFDRTNEAIIDEMKKIILSCRRKNNYFTIDVDSFEVIEDYDKINKALIEYFEKNVKKKNTSKKKINPYEFISLKDSDIILLKVRYFIRVKDEYDFHDVYIMVPRLVDKYYFRINGIYYLGLYQIVDGSTYNNSTSSLAKNPSITMKIVFMVTKLYRLTIDMKPTRGEPVKCAYYMARLFNKSVPAMKYILAKKGYYGAIQFLGLNEIYVTDYDICRDDFYTFKKRGELFVSVPKYLFDNDLVTQTFVMTLYNAIIPGMNINTIYTQEFWVRSLGGDFNNYTQEKMLAVLNNDQVIPDTIDKGYGILDSFESIYDISTRDELKLPFEMKRDTYCLIRWIIREFNYLKQKDNLDLSIKKLRYETYISTLYAMKLVKGIYRIADMNKKVTINAIRKAINTNPNYLLKVIIKCKLVNYRNMVSDLDSVVALKCTYKGVSGLGESGQNSIPDIFRAVHLSHLGRMDLDSSSNSDPGVTGTLCPFTKIYNNYFSDYQEPNFWEKEFGETLSTYFKASKLVEPITFEENVLGVDKSEEKAILNETLTIMEQLIKPIIFEDEKEGFSQTDLVSPITFDDGLNNSGE